MIVTSIVNEENPVRYALYWSRKVCNTGIAWLNSSSVKEQSSFGVFLLTTSEGAGQVDCTAAVSDGGASGPSKPRSASAGEDGFASSGLSNLVNLLLIGLIGSARSTTVIRGLTKQDYFIIRDLPCKM